ncbi:uncharacterized protein LOC130901088 [Diorhabda carinulata]|uniref:uncharacterized protein LOC130901088 n=1 Tax=Diorhabda carinulata TaxID=1163345 RepID=UPI0025A028E1|nr:uncharacterized protein LOC130901088 [Diorhabda carinulata]
MNRSNMLTANKVKLHGMTSSKWTTKDQITQYKGLINLYTKDRNVLKSENDIPRRRQARELKKLQRNIDINRKALDNLLKGDKQKLQNILQDHRELKILFQEAPPQKAIDVIHKANFNKRKLKDLLSYKIKLKSNILTDLKLKCAEYEDALKYKDNAKLLPCERKAYTLNGKVQDAFLKIEAAVYIRNSYTEIVALMKKDAIYFDAVLSALEKDGLNQAKCLLNLTKVGQEAIEYLTNRRNEFMFLERLVRNEMWERRQDLEIVQQNVQDFADNLKHLIRDDNDVNTGEIRLNSSRSYDILKQEIDGIEITINKLKNSFSAHSVDQMYPLLKEQFSQKERLMRFMEKCKSAKEELVRKTKLASVVYSKTRNTTLDTTDSYNILKVKLKDNILKELSYTKEIQVGIDDRCELLAKIRVSLKHLQLLSRLLNTEVEEITPIYQRKSLPPFKPEKDEIEILNIIPELLRKFAKLANKSEQILDTKFIFNGFQLFEVLMRDRSKPIQIDIIHEEESLIEADVIDATVPTAKDIKKQSEEIVALGLAALEYKPPPPTKKPYKYRRRNK